VAVVVLAVLAGALAVTLPTVRHRAASTVDPSDPTARDRLAMMQVALHLAREHPITGVGPGQLKRLYPQLAPPEALRRSTSHVHNSPLQIVAERGLVGLAAWLWIFVAFFYRAGAILLRLPERAGDDRLLVIGSLGAIVTFLVAGLFEYNFGDTEVLMLALTLMALPFALAGDAGAACETGIS
jgi:O-antigen ligase